MNPGPVEEVGKLGGSFIDSLKREPLSLALVVMNLALLVFFYFLLITVAAQREREVNLIYDDKKRVNELLAKCVVPQHAELELPFGDRWKTVETIRPLPKPLETEEPPK